MTIGQGDWDGGAHTSEYLGDFGPTIETHPTCHHCPLAEYCSMLPVIAAWSAATRGCSASRSPVCGGSPVAVVWMNPHRGKAGYQPVQVYRRGAAAR